VGQSLATTQITSARFDRPVVGLPHRRYRSNSGLMPIADSGGHQKTIGFTPEIVIGFPQKP
jgi:hypothetical protein